MLGVFRKRSAGSDEAIPEDLLANVPELGASAAPVAAEPVRLVPVSEVDDDALLEAERAMAKVATAWNDMERRVHALEAENQRLHERLREAEAKAHILDEVRASLSKAK